MMIVIGTLAAFIVNAILASSGDWRLMLGLAAVPSAVLLIGMFFVPERPPTRTAPGPGARMKPPWPRRRPAAGRRG
jgi:major inositol transporter-like SP family MFS transporter